MDRSGPDGAQPPIAFIDETGSFPSPVTGLADKPSYDH